MINIKLAQKKFYHILLAVFGVRQVDLNVICSLLRILYNYILVPESLSYFVGDLLKHKSNPIYRLLHYFIAYRLLLERRYF